MAITALTLTTALANAQAVYDSKEKKLCLNRNFIPDENFENRATIEQLMAQVEKLPPKEGPAEKKRLMVFLNLLYPTVKKPDGKEKEKEPKKPETFEQFRQAVAARFKAPEPSEEVHQRKGSTIEIAKEIQKELSTLLVALEYLKFEREFTDKTLKMIEKMSSFEAERVEIPLEEPEVFALFVSLKLKPMNYILTGVKGPCSDIRTLSQRAYKKLLSLLDHPHPLVSKFAKKLYLAKKSADEMAATGLRDKFESYHRYLVRLFSNCQNKEMLKRVCPELMAFEMVLSSAKSIESQGVPNYADVQVAGFFERFAQNDFLQTISKRYTELYEEFQVSQGKLLSTNKGILAKKFSVRLGEFYLPKTPRKENFPTPDEFVEIFSELKKPFEKTPEAKEKTPSDAVAKVSIDSSNKTDGKEKASEAPASKKPSADDSFVKTILRSSQPIVYDDRVKDWQTVRVQTPSGYTPENALWKHAFTTIVDPFVGTDYSFQDVWKNTKTGNEDPCYCILADVTFPSGETVPGVFQYTFDAEGVCYHRWFGKMSNIERLDKAINEKRQQINFPPLAKAKKPSVEVVDSIQFEVDPYFGSITFKDKENNLKIKIYKVEE